MSRFVSVKWWGLTPAPRSDATITLTARRKGDDAVIAHRTVLVRPDIFTFVFLGPDSRD